MQNRPSAKNNIRENSNYSGGQRRKWRDINRPKKEHGFFELLGFTLALLVLSAQFWRYFSLTVLGVEIDPYGQELIILRTSILTLGIIIIAVKFDDALLLFGRSFGTWPLLILTFLSVVWSYNPSETLQQSLLLLLLITFSFAITLRYSKKNAASLLAVCSILILGFEFLNLLGNRFLSLSLYRLPALSSALVFSVWAAFENKQWRGVHILGVIILLVLGMITKEPTLEISLIGVLTGAGFLISLKYIKDYQLRIGAIIVVLLCYFAYMLARYGTQFTDGLSDAFSQLDNRAIQGFGFGTNGNSIYAKFIYGLGLIGIMAITFYLFTCIIFGLFVTSNPSVLIAFFGMLAIILSRPITIDFISIELIGFLCTGNFLVLARRKLVKKSRN